MTLNTDIVINGSYGKIFLGDTWLANVQRVEGRIVIDRREVFPPGTRERGYKSMGTSGEGTITGLKVTSFWLKTIGNYQRDRTAKQTTYILRYILEDPESLGTEEVELTRVKFWEIPFGYQVNEILEEGIPFTFQNHNLLNCIDGDMDTYADGGTSRC